MLVAVQSASAESSVGQSFSVIGSSGALASPGRSFASGEIVWVVPAAPTGASFVSAGGSGIVTVSVAVSICPAVSVTR